MERVWTLLLFGVGLVLVVLPLVMVREYPWLLPLLPLGAWTLHVSGKRDDRRVEHDLEQRQSKVQEVQAGLANTPLKTDEVLMVKSDSHIWFAGLGIVVAGFLLGVGGPFIKLLLILLATLFLFLLLVGLGKPRLQLDAKGFRTPLYGHIPWSAVNNVDLEIIKLRHNGATGFHYMLRFRIDDYKRAVAAIPRTAKVLLLFGQGPIVLNTISVYLGTKSKNSNQETVYGVARFFWQQSR
jgi:hypothetical protein